jgi:hypothetical protein
MSYTEYQALFKNNGLCSGRTGGGRSDGNTVVSENLDSFLDNTYSTVADVEVDSAVDVVAVDSAGVEIVAEARSLVLPHRHQRRAITRFAVHITHERVGTGRPMEMVGTEIRVVSQSHRVRANGTHDLEYRLVFG